MKKCPLCGNNKSFILKEYYISDLSNRWICDFGFNPFDEEISNRKTIKKLRCYVCDIVYYDPEYCGGSQFYEQLSKNPWYYEKDKWEFDKTITLISGSSGY